MKKEAEKQRAEHGEDVDVPASFGEKPEDAATFKPITFKSKKRTLEEVNQQGAQSACKPDEIASIKMNGHPAGDA